MKKILILLVLCVSLCLFAAYDDSKTGTTTDAYVTVHTLSLNGAPDFNISIINTGSNSLDYVVYGYISTKSTTPVTIASGTLAAGSKAEICYERRFMKIVTQVKSTSSGSATTYEYSWVIPSTYGY